MINPFASKKKEQVNPIGGAMGGFDEEFEQGLEDKPKGPQILGSITFNLPDFTPEVAEVVNSFYGLLRDDVFGRAEILPKDPNAQEATASFTRQHNQAMEAASQRLSMQKQEDLMRAALRMSGDKVTIIDVVTTITPNTNPIQAQRETARMEALGISDVVSVVGKVETRDEQVEDAEKDRSMQAAQRSSAIANQSEGAHGQVSSTGALANLSTTGGGAG